MQSDAGAAPPRYRSQSDFETADAGRVGRIQGPLAPMNPMLRTPGFLKQVLHQVLV